MIIPIRCISCGKPIAQFWEEYNESVSKGKKPKDIMDKMGLTRYCCRSAILSHVDTIDEVARFKA